MLKGMPLFTSTLWAVCPFFCCPFRVTPVACSTSYLRPYVQCSPASQLSCHCTHGRPRWHTPRDVYLQAIKTILAALDVTPVVFVTLRKSRVETTPLAMGGGPSSPIQVCQHETKGGRIREVAGDASISLINTIGYIEHYFTMPPIIQWTYWIGWGFLAPIGGPPKTSLCFLVRH